MSDRKFTREEKKKLKETMNFILDDMTSLWELNYCKKIKFNVDVVVGDHFSYLVMDKLGFRLETYFRGYLEERVWLQKNLFPSGKVRPINYNVCFNFLSIYEHIRKQIESEIVIDKFRGDSSFSKIDELRKRYDKEASIEIDMPVQNQQQLKVSRENGKMVGVLDFGDRTIKIITNGSIVLVNKDEKELERIVYKYKK